MIVKLHQDHPEWTQEMIAADMRRGRLPCSQRSVSDILKLWRETGDVTPRNASRLWPPHHVEELERLVDASSGLYLDELANLLNCSEAVSGRGSGERIRYSKERVCEKLQELRLTRKLYKRRGHLRDEEEIADYYIMTMDLSAEMLLFYDETRLDPKDLARKRGRSKAGTQPLKEDLGSHAEPHSALAVCSCMGVLDFEAVPHGFNGDTFFAAFERCVVPHVAPFPCPGSVVIGDNAPVHSPLRDQMTDAVEARGGILLWLARYAPETNPIEEIFKSVKDYLKRRGYFLESEEWNTELYGRAFASVTPTNALAAYEHAGYFLTAATRAALRREGRL